MPIKTVRDIEVKGKTVFVRCDFNVPISGTGQITDDTRLLAALPTIRYLQEHNAKIIMASHLGRPIGTKDQKYSLRPVALDLSMKLGSPVLFADDCVGSAVSQMIEGLQDGQVMLLENVRFHEGEEKNDPEFARQLAENIQVYVNDAFGSAHRAHASTAGITHHVDGPKVAGFLIEKELKYLGENTADPERPFVVILGGAKVSDKISVIDALLEKADTILIGGAMAYTFKLAQGGKVGKSLAEPDKVEVARKALQKAEAKGVKFLLPVDNMITDKLDFNALQVGELKASEGDIPDEWEGVDIGPKTVELYEKELSGAKTVLWNGPMGIFEIEACATGTFAIAKAVAQTECVSIIGGGDSVKAINKSGQAANVSFMSTGGGASLEFLEGKNLPGVDALDQS